MSTKKPVKPPNKSYEVTFVNCELDTSTKELVRNFDPKFTTTLDCVDRLVFDGYKISVSYDKYHNCVSAFCTHPANDHPHHGLCLSARAPSYLNALKVLVYKHFTILQENWDTAVDQSFTNDGWA